MTTTPNRGYTEPTVGGDANTWGGELNENFVLIDANISADDTIPASGTVDVTVSGTQAENLTLAVTGTLTADINLVIPSLGAFHFVRNATTGGKTITATTASPGTTVPIAAGTTALIGCDGTNVYAGDSPTDVTASAQGTLQIGPILLQWGNDVTGGIGSAVVTYPQAFSTAFQFLVSSTDSAGATIFGSSGTPGATSTTVFATNLVTQSPAPAEPFSWFAVGLA